MMHHVTVEDVHLLSPSPPPSVLSSPTAAGAKPAFGDFEVRKLSSTITECVSRRKPSPTMKWGTTAAVILSALAYLLHGAGVALAVLAIVGIITIVVTVRAVEEESVLIIQDFGIQVKRRHANGREVSRFLDKDKIAGVCINEGLTFTRVVFYLAFVVVGEPEMVVAYKSLNPSMHNLLRVYAETMAAGFAGQDDDLQAVLMGNQQR